MGFAQATNADSLAKVDMTSYGCSTNVEPIDILRRKFVGWGCFDSVNPTLELALAGYNANQGNVQALTTVRALDLLPGIGNFPCLFKKAE